MKIIKISCIHKIDSFKSNWFLWEAEAEMEDGSIVTGTVQADFMGELVADETFESDE